MPGSPDESDRRDDRGSDVWSGLDAFVPTVETPAVPSVPDLRAEFDAFLGDAQFDPGVVEDALADVDRPALADADVEASELPGGVVDGAGEAVADATDGVSEATDAVVEAGGETVAVAVDRSGEAASVVLDSGSDAVEVVVENGGEEAAEAALEALAAALDGL